MNKLILTIFLILIACPVQAYQFAENWTKTDTVYEVAFLTVTTLDWAQTHSMAKADWVWDGHSHSEMNPLLGSKPSKEKVDFMIPAGMVLHVLIAVALPPHFDIGGFDIHPRRAWQLIWIGIETGATINNASGGIKIEF